MKPIALVLGNARKPISDVTVVLFLGYLAITPKLSVLSSAQVARVTDRMDACSDAVAV